MSELLNYFNGRLEQEMHSKTQDITVDKNKLLRLLVEAEVLLGIRATQARHLVAE